MAKVYLTVRAFSEITLCMLTASNVRSLVGSMTSIFWMGSSC